MFTKVTARLASPLALSADGVPPNLDAIVEYAMSAKARTIAESRYGHRHPIANTHPGSAVSEQGTLPIPIKRKWITVEDGRKIVVPRVSQGILAPCRETAEHYHCSFPIDRSERLLDKERTTINATSGQFKSARLPLRVVDTDCVVWFAELRKKQGRSPKSELRRILRKSIPAIGKKTSQGFGVVAEWVIEDSDLDASWIYNGVLMRPLPVSLVLDQTAGCRRDFGAVSSPYWQRDFWCERFVPI